MATLYEFFWFHTEFWLKPKDRRPYTYIFRDIYHKFPLPTITGLGVFFYCLGRWWAQVSLGVFLVLVIALIVGEILGHLFWGKKYIPEQQEAPTYTGS